MAHSKTSRFAFASLPAAALLSSALLASTAGITKAQMGTGKDDNYVIVINQGYFSLAKPDNGFPIGKYRLEIYMGKELLKTVSFNVKPK